MTTDALDAIAHAGYLARGGYPSTLGYRGFQKSMCTSVNEVVVHGIPDDRPLEPGDIVNCDVTIYLDGMHGDCSATFPVGEIDEAARKLLRVTEESLLKGIEAVRPGRQIREIGRAIAAHADAAGFGVVRNYCGHGIGEIFHTELQIPHFDDPDATTPIEEGMIFTIEPMLTEGSWGVKHWDDGWTAITADGKRSAQMEHTVLVGRDGAEILTLPSDRPAADRPFGLAAGAPRSRHTSARVPGRYRQVWRRGSSGLRQRGLAGTSAHRYMAARPPAPEDSSMPVRHRGHADPDPTAPAPRRRPRLRSVLQRPHVPRRPRGQGLGARPGGAPRPPEHRPGRGRAPVRRRRCSRG